MCKWPLTTLHTFQASMHQAKKSNNSNKTLVWNALRSFAQMLLSIVNIVFSINKQNYCLFFIFRQFGSLSYLISKSVVLFSKLHCDIVCRCGAVLTVLKSLVFWRTFFILYQNRKLISKYDYFAVDWRLKIGAINTSEMQLQNSNSNIYNSTLKIPDYQKKFNNDHSNKICNGSIDTSKLHNQQQQTHFSPCGFV